MTDDFKPQDVAWVFDMTALRDLLGAMGTAERVVYDLETTGLDEYDQRGAAIVLASLTLPQPDDADPLHPTTWIVPLAHPESPWLGRWRKVVRHIAGAIVESRQEVDGHNVKFDSRWTFAHSGIDLSHNISWDSHLSARLLNENRTSRLKERASELFDIERWDDFDLREFGAAQRVPLFDLGLYAARDTYWTWRLGEAHRATMFAQGDSEPQDAEEEETARLGTLARWCTMPTSATMAAIEQRGLTLDRQWCETTRKGLLEEAGALTLALAGRYLPEGEVPDLADVSFAPTSRWYQAWAERAVEAGDLRVTAITPTGKPQWSKAVLVRQARAGGEGNVAATLLELRSATKRAEFLTSWLGYQTPAGTVHAEYNVGTVVTGRLSSSKPNMQQITASLWPAWIPSPGHAGATLDYSQIEMRVAAFISRCLPMLEAFRDGVDTHVMLASTITGKPEDEVTKDDRQKGKSANFGLLYGMSAAGFQIYAETAYGLVLTEEEASAAHAAFFQTWDGIGEWHARCMTDLHRTGKAVSPLGRVRHLPVVWGDFENWRGHGGDPMGEAERMAINSPVQGMASDLMQMAAASIEGTLPGSTPVRDARLVGTVHDSILVEVPEGDWERVTRECMDRMTREVVEVLAVRFHVDLDVPLTVEAKIGTRWGLSDLAVLT